MVSVIVAAYNSAEFLPRCLESIATQSFKNFETIVINSSPEDRTAQVVSRFSPVRFVQRAERLLPHAAMNAGVAEARGALLVFTAADTRAEPGWLASLVASHELGHQVIGGSIDTEAKPRISRGIQILKYYPYLRGKPAGSLTVAASGNMLVSRTAWELVGPFDGSIYSGDALFSWKARKEGLIPWYEPAAVVYDLDELYRKGFLAGRFERGKEFGKVRAAFEEWNTARRILGIVCAPLAVISVLAKSGRECHRARRLGDFVATIHLQAAAQAAWCAGEALGCFRRIPAA